VNDETQLAKRIVANGNYQEVKTQQDLIEHTLCHEGGGRVQAQLTCDGALRVKTGDITGRSPRDRYFVTGTEFDEHINWNKTNQPLDREVFMKMMDRALEHMKNLPDPLFYSDEYYAGADPAARFPLRIITQYGWHQLFGQLMYRKGKPGEDREGVWTVLALPRFMPDPELDGIDSDGIIAIDLKERVVLIGNRLYAGELWKSVFTAINTVLPLKRKILPMHCGVNMTRTGRVTVFLGLSGTGKTTLSTDEQCVLIGDDGHSWSDSGIANLTGGCYAKLHDLAEEREPLIYRSMSWGAVMENVELDDERRPLYDQGPENIRGAYDIKVLGPNAEPSGRAGHPDAIIMLTCDMNGVLPPVAILRPEQALFHFLAGYTTKVASTEGGTHGGEPTISAFYGEAFFAALAHYYLELFKQKLRVHNVPVYLVNTGWIGGPKGHPNGRRISIATSRAIVHAIQNGTIDRSGTRDLPEHGLTIPNKVPGVETRNLDPRIMWTDEAAYERGCAALAEFIVPTMLKKFPDVSQEVLSGGPPYKP